MHVQLKKTETQEMIQPKVKTCTCCSNNALLIFLDDCEINELTNSITGYEMYRGSPLAVVYCTNWNKTTDISHTPHCTMIIQGTFLLTKKNPTNFLATEFQS